MRTSTILAVITAVALTGVAGCSTTTTSANVPATATTAGSATTVVDETATVCAQALAQNSSVPAEFAKVLQLRLHANNESARNELDLNLHEIVTNWQVSLAALSNKHVKSEVRTALAEVAASLKELNNPIGPTPVETLATRFGELGARISTVCS
jgi:hypothetical protein